LADRKAVDRYNEFGYCPLEAAALVLEAEAAEDFLSFPLA
jgi:hypothetical protein